MSPQRSAQHRRQSTCPVWHPCFDDTHNNDQGKVDRWCGRDLALLSLPVGASACWSICHRVRPRVRSTWPTHRNDTVDTKQRIPTNNTQVDEKSMLMDQRFWRLCASILASTMHCFETETSPKRNQSVEREWEKVALSGMRFV